MDTVEADRVVVAGGCDACDTWPRPPAPTPKFGGEENRLPMPNSCDAPTSAPAAAAAIPMSAPVVWVWVWVWVWAWALARPERRGNGLLPERRK